MDASKLMLRASYLNAILIQSRGRAGKTCLDCARNPNRGPFVECRRARGHFDGCCGNCKWRDHAIRCSVRNPGISADEDTDEGEQRDDGVEESEEEDVEVVEVVEVHTDEEDDNAYKA